MRLSVSAFLIFAVTHSVAYAVTPRSSLTVDSIGSGGYQATYYQSGTVSVPEVLVIGVYETSSNHSFNFHPTGTGHVHVLGSAQAPVDVVVSSYEPVHWIFDEPECPISRRS